MEDLEHSNSELGIYGKSPHTENHCHATITTAALHLEQAAGLGQELLELSDRISAPF